MLKSFKYRLYPNKVQRELLSKQFGCCRFVYNYYLNERIELYNLVGKTLSYYDTTSDLTFLKDDFLWLRDVIHNSLAQSLRDLDKAYKNFFRRYKLNNGKKLGFPKFKSKRSKQSFRLCKNFVIDNTSIRISKFGYIKAKVHRPIEGTSKFITVSKTATGKYFASVTC